MFIDAIICLDNSAPIEPPAPITQIDLLLMSVDYIFTIFGYLGAGCLSIMMIPQVWHTVKTKKTEDLSIKFLLFNMLAICFLLPYSIYYRLYPILISNILSESTGNYKISRTGRTT